MRGWSRPPPAPARTGGVVPARAGLVPSPSTRWCSAPRGPRACGVGPPAYVDQRAQVRWSPRVRGWSLPAFADASGAIGGPRACGVGPSAAAAPPASTRWSPRVRGWSRAALLGGEAAVVVPARAGLVPGRSSRRRPAASGPRACGVGPSTNSAASPVRAWSPRVRGWSPPRSGALDRRPVVPARAGLVPRCPEPPRAPESGPRACGVGPRMERAALIAAGWSPRVRGWSHHPQPGVRVHRCGPRACGVGPQSMTVRASLSLWSPRVRGWSLAQRTGPVGVVVVPARAGLVPGQFAEQSLARRGPRAYEVDPPETGRRDGTHAWSPRVRGWSHERLRETAGGDVVPAHAGLPLEMTEAVRRPRHTTAAPHDCRRAGATDRPRSGRGKRHRGDKPLPPVRTGPAGPRRGQGGDPR